jgi:hypothetical protein
VTSKFCVKNEGANPVAGFVHVNDTTANSGSNTFACRSRGTLAAPTVVQNGDSLWNMYIAGNDGTDLALAAEIRVEVDGVPGSNDMPGRILLRTTPDGSQAPVDAVKIDSAQNVTVSAGNLVIGTSGKGIDFSATSGTGTSELLNDYEEGTWTPTLGTTGTSLTSVTYDPQVGGRYIRVGNVVHVQGYMRTDAVTVGAATGLVILSGLPFTSAANTGTTADGQSAATLAASETWAINNPSAGRVSSNSAAILLYYRVTANGDSSPLPVSAIATGADSNITNFTATYVCA